MQDEVDYIAQFIWNARTIRPETSKEYPGGVPSAEPEAELVVLDDDTAVWIASTPCAPEVWISLEDCEDGQMALIRIPCDRVIGLVSALLRVHRQTHQYEYEEWTNWSEVPDDQQG